MTLNCILVYPNKLLFILKIFSYNIHQSILGIIMGNKSKKSKLIIPANKDKAPREISQLINLEKLFLQNNYLTGDLPDFLWELKNLKVLNLSNNQFSCQIPGEIHVLQLLEELWISNNNIYGDVPHQIFSQL